MMCISPITIANRDTGELMTVPCSKCFVCLQNKRNDWTFRIREELKQAQSAIFVTLTYDIENLRLSDDLQPTLLKRDVQLFLKRLRKFNDKIYKKYAQDKNMASGLLKRLPIRYYCCGEYGEKTYRPHYHAIIFNITDEAKENIAKLWGYGNTHVGSCTVASIHYTTKYIINKGIHPRGTEKPFALMSRKPALGSSYLDKATKWHLENNHFHVISDNYKQNLPRFYKEKIFSKPTIQEHSIKMRRISDEIAIRRQKALEDQGINPARYRQDVIENQRININKRIKKGKEL